jgi:hypothetical protein
MVAGAQPISEIVPNAKQAGRVFFQVAQAAHQGTHVVTRDSAGFHVQLGTPANLGELGPIPNRMAGPFCAKITVQDRKTTPGQVICYDEKGAVQFKFGDPEAVTMVFHLLARKTAT